MTRKQNPVSPIPCVILATMALWLLSAPLRVESAETPQESRVSEPAPVATPQRLDLPSYQDPESPLPGVGVTSQIFTALGIVLGVLALGVFLYKRVALRGLRGSGHDGTIRILNRTYLGPKESLCLVQVGTDILLLGQTGSGITLLHTLPSSVSAAQSDSDTDAASTGEIGGTEHRAPSRFAREREAALTGLESRLKRLNKLWEMKGSA